MGLWFGRQDKERERRDELLSAYLDGRLDVRERARLEAQLASDPALRAELEALRRTVALVRDLPRVSAPRNFILPQTVALRPRPAPLRSRRLFAPLLTTATSIAALLFIAVLVSDLWSATGPRLSMAPAAAPAPVEERQAVIVTAAVEQQDMGNVPTAPVLAMVAPTEETVEVAGEGDSGSAPPVPPSPVSAAPAAWEGGLAPPPTLGPATPESAIGVPPPTSSPEAYGMASPTATAEVVPFAGEEEMPTPGPERTPAVKRSGPLPFPIPREVEIGLGVIVLILGGITIWAWGARRR